MFKTVDELLDSLVAKRIVSDSSVSAYRERSSDGDVTSIDDCLDALTKGGVITDHQATELKTGKFNRLAIGRYVVLNPIGRGGMGVVYLARHDTLGKKIALKVLPEDLAHDQRQRRRFQREMETLAKLEHPHIAQTFDGGEGDDGSLFFAMEYLSKGTLADRVRRMGPMSVNDAINVMTDVCGAVEYGHRKGIVHRDLKPGNLGVNEFGVVKVLDLGLAQIASATDGFGTTIDRITHTGQILGTADYMAPEQARGSSDADHRVDIYSLGCTLYCLLTGHPPYDGDSIMEKITAHQRGEIPDLRRERPDVPVALQDLFRSMVAKKPGDRPDTSEIVQQQLQNISALVEQDSASVGSKWLDSGASDSITGSHAAPPRSASVWLSLTSMALALLTLAIVGGLYGTSMLGGAKGTSDTTGTNTVAIDESTTNVESRAETIAPPSLVDLAPEELRFQVATAIIDQGGEIWLDSNTRWDASSDRMGALDDAWKLVLRGNLSENEILPNLERFQKVEIIRFEDSAEGSLQLGALRLPRLVERIDWIRSPLRDEVLQQLPTLERLESLSLQETEVTGQAGAHLVRWAPNLRSLTVIDNRSIDANFVIGLIGLPRLAEITLDAHLLNVGAAASLSRLVRLNQLKLIGDPNSSAMNAIAGLRSLKHLVLATADLSQQAVDALVQTEGLERLTLEGFTGDASKLVALLQDAKIGRITLHSCPLSLDSVAAIERLAAAEQSGRLWATGQLNQNATAAAVRELLACKAKILVAQRGQQPVKCVELAGLPSDAQIVEVQLSPNEPTSVVALSTLKGLFGLRKFVIRSQLPEWTVEHTRIVSSLTGLQTLVMEGIPLTDKGLASLANLTNLRSLELQPLSECTEAGLLPVIMATRLHHLHVVGIPVSNAFYKAVRSHAKLKQLWLRESELATNHDAIFPMLAELKDLNQLYLGHPKLSGQGLELLASIPNLKSIGFSGSVIGQLSVLKSFPALNRISVVGISSEKVRLVADLKNLEDLVFYYGQVSVADLKKLAAMPNLTYLTMVHLDLDDASIVNGLKEASGLRNLRVEGTFATNDLVSRLAGFLPNCRVEVIASRRLPTTPVVFVPDWDPTELGREWKGQSLEDVWPTYQSPAPEVTLVVNHSADSQPSDSRPSGDSKGEEDLP